MLNVGFPFLSNENVPGVVSPLTESVHAGDVLFLELGGLYTKRLDS